MTLLKEGRSQEELMQILQEMDEATSMDSFLRNENKVTIHCEREEGRLRNWKIHYTNASDKKPFSTGSTYRRFMDQLNKMELENEEENALFDTPDCSVLCYLSTDAHRTWDGKVVSYWADIDPAVPYQFKDGRLDIPTIQLEFDEQEYSYMVDTGLAFHEKRSEMFYPLSETAFQSIGKLLDAQSAFRNIDEHLLGTALVFAEKIAGLNELRLICRKKSSCMKQVHSVAGRRYQLFSQKKFFELMLNNAATTLGAYQMESWSVSEDITNATILYEYPWNEYTFYLTFSTGDTNAIPFRVQLGVMYKGASYVLLTNTAKHEASFTEESIPKLLNGISEKMMEYDKLHHELANHDCNFNPFWLKKVNVLLGKKRVNQLQEIESGYYNALDLWDLIVSTRGTVHLPNRQTDGLKIALTQVLYDLRDSWVNSTSNQETA